MDKRLTFNEDVENYDKWRPEYCDELFKDILEYARIGKDKKVIEIGIGTGQATKPFLDKGCELTAVELGENLAAYSKSKFQRYKNFTVQHSSFENFNYQEGTIDFIYSATAFHWIPKEKGYPKVLKLLKPGGTLALFWNRPFVSRENDKLHQKIQNIYQKYRPSNTKIIENDTNKYNDRLKTIQSYGFKDIVFKLYHLTRVFSSSDYISLLNTYSDHKSLPDDIKKLLEHEIKKAIIDLGNKLNVFDTIDLYLSRK
ncbi:class I SAM-dependent methyltransferase [Oceanobacillus jeddahense]|uniref:Class I SAM-dependent methyltransferase n=1 Tax=Oceanobacillus jeddahense TaxID=1462527 RepID=A0ABY5JX67_9BACI|nr:class I SAM-dependent methyltransferase [Oceanobacillus jeddahense]UUI04724.1 class I SAM-dependent methyltransferase [Oceanobacillus jeddahense]